jgi:hypothetical protein
MPAGGRTHVLDAPHVVLEPAAISHVGATNASGRLAAAPARRLCVAEAAVRRPSRAETSSSSFSSRCSWNGLTGLPYDAKVIVRANLRLLLVGRG